MEIQLIKISDQEKELLSNFYGEDLGNEIDFNRLMPVVEKIEKEHEVFMEVRHNTTFEKNRRGDLERKFIGWEILLWKVNSGNLGVCTYQKIDAYYQSVINYIKWYNLQKP